MVNRKESGVEWESGTLNLQNPPTGQPPTTILKMSLTPGKLVVKMGQEIGMELP